MDNLIKSLRELAALAHADVSVADEAADKIESLSKSLTDLLRWCEALAIVGSVTPEAWRELDKLTTKANKAIAGKK